jgi:hypothetical protein
MTIITRYSRTSRLDITTSVAATTSAPVAISEYVSGALEFPSAWTTTGDDDSIAFHVASTLDGEYKPLLDSDGAVSTSTVVVDSWRPLPAEVMACPAFKIVAGVAQAADRTIGVAMKS